MNLELKTSTSLNSRRDFVRKFLAGSSIFALNGLPFISAFEKELEMVRLTILHTNDWHSRIESFPMDGSKNEGLGGVAKRSALIKKIRNYSPNTLLLDCGDIFQGTPYFNFYGGELEFKLMKEMKYDAATMGNHDFDGGIEGFNKQLPIVDFPFLTANYNFENTILAGKTQDYKIFTFGKIKVGVYGLGIELKGLVPEVLYGKTIYLDPIDKAKQIESKLKNDEGCDYIICLSHLGYKYDENKVSDHTLAANTNYTNLILGGHTHTFLKKPTPIKNLKGESVLINQAGWAGIMLGKVDITFEMNKKGQCVTCENIQIS